MRAGDNVSRSARLWILLFVSVAACHEPTTSAPPIVVAPPPPPPPLPTSPPAQPPASPPPSPSLGVIAFTIAGGGIHTMNVDGTNWVRLGDGFAPAWMPDGSLLYLSQACPQCPLLPWIRTSDGNTHSFLPDAVSSGWNFYGPSPTVDGSRVAFIRGTKPNAYAMPDSHELVIVTVGEFSLTKVPLPDAIVPLDRPSWSPDQSRIVFSCATKDENLVNVDLCFVNTDGSGFVRFGRDDEWEWQPAWNPKTGVIAFTRSRDIGGDTWSWLNTIGREDGRELNDYGYGEGAAWSPDGSTLLFCRGALIAVSDNVQRIVYPNPRGPFLYELAWGGK